MTSNQLLLLPQAPGRLNAPFFYSPPSSSIHTYCVPGAISRLKSCKASAPRHFQQALCLSLLGTCIDVSPHVADVGEDEEELGHASMLLLQSQTCLGHQVDQGVYDLVQDTVDMVLLFQRLEGAGQKGVHS